MKTLLLRNKALTAGTAVLLIAALSWLAFGFFGIHKAFVDDVVNEDAPVFDVVASADVATPVAQTAPVEVPAAEDASDTPVEVEAVPARSEDAPGASAEVEAVPARSEDAPGASAEVEAVPARSVEDASGAPVEVEAVPAAPAEVEAPVPATEDASDTPAADETASLADDTTPVPEPTATPIPTPVPEPTATPVPVPTPEPTPEPQSAPGEIVTQFSGSFQSLNDYSVSGTASVLSNGTEQRFLRFENFASDNGPDLKVYLRAASGEFVTLGSLSGNIGNQNYEIPAGVDLNVFNSVEIWCERFNSGFGTAPLNAA